MCIRMVNVLFSILIFCADMQLTMASSFKTVYAKMYGDITLKCSTLPGTSVSWQHKRHVYAVENNISNRLKGKILVTRDSLKNVYNLRIINVTRLDEGKYYCISSYGISSKEVLFNLKLMNPPSNIAILNETNGFLYSSRNKEMSLVCTSQEGTPAENLFWVSNSMILAQGSRTVVYNITVTDDQHLKLYTCKADHPALYKSLEKFVQIILKEPPRVELFPLPSHNVVTGQNMSLVCKLDHHIGIQKISWTKNNALMHHWGTDITFEHVTEKVRGVYCCNAENQFGTRSACQHIRIGKPPKVSVDVLPSPMVRSGNNLSLLCNVNDSSAIKRVQWTRDDKSLYSKAFDVFLQNVKPQSSGSYCCVVENVFGTTITSLAIKIRGSHTTGNATERNASLSPGFKLHIISFAIATACTSIVLIATIVIIRHLRHHTSKYIVNQNHEAELQIQDLDIHSITSSTHSHYEEIDETAVAIYLDVYGSGEDSSLVCGNDASSESGSGSSESKKTLPSEDPKSYLNSFNYLLKNDNTERKNSTCSHYDKMNNTAVVLYLDVCGSWEESSLDSRCNVSQTSRSIEPKTTSPSEDPEGYLSNSHLNTKKDI